MRLREAGRIPDLNVILPVARIHALNSRRARVVSIGSGSENLVLGDDLTAAALMDRRLHHCHIVNTRDNSYRTRAHQELWPSIQREDGDASPAHEAGP